MPNRIIKESVCTSDSVDALTWFEEVFFYRLIVNCDDYGRADARPAILRSRLFPLKSVTDKQIKDALQSLRTAGIVYLYEVDGKPFLQLRTWEKHQNVRAKKSKYPSPDDGVSTSESNCKQMHSNASKCPRNPIQSESNPNPNPNPTTRESALDVAFNDFWSAYPKKVGKQAAFKAFKKVSADIRPLLVSAVERQKRSIQWAKDNGQYIPNPATWLNEGRWDDELVEGGNRDGTPNNPGNTPAKTKYHLKSALDE